ncbi:uncharacterized protein At4g22160 [Cornus florida]|uniref:uncharacterized protein At4g22160 n=1 Tax=Cornus florida TaxID=4283 RepID=UPI00289F4BE9|nr:uncharacterized protein At4g22160 [Cornus florida]
MADAAGRSEPNRGARNDEKRLKYAFDAGFLSGANPSDTPNTVDADDGDSATLKTSDSESSDSDCDSKQLAGLAASFRVFSESMLRMELAEMEMIKAREALRYEAEKRRVESEAEMTRMLLQTQLQIASFLSRTCVNRKRKRSADDETSTSEREGAMLLSLLQCNLI